MKQRAWRVVLYEDSASEWRWSLRAGNGERVADSSEGYSSQRKCRQAIDRVAANLTDARIEVESDGGVE